MTALPNPGAKLMNEINREMRNFMGRKRAKIKLQKLTRTYERGGLRLTNIQPL